MHHRLRWSGLLAGLAGLSGLAGAAPLDPLLDVRGDPQAPTRWTAEMAGDVTQPVFDAFGVDRRAGRTGSVRLGLTTGAWSFELAGHRRSLHDKLDDYQVQGWQSAIQYEPGEPDPRSALRWALRFSAWGNQADHLVRTSNTSLKVSGLKARLTELELVLPRDRQLQFDVVGRYTLADTGWAISGFAGAGTSEVTRSSVSGKATISGCDYQLQFGEARLTALPMPGCPRALIVSVPNQLLAVDALAETRYRSVYGHAGGAVHWQSSPWRLALGAELQQWQRSGQEERQTRNAVVASEAAHALTPTLSVVLRGQYQHRQMLSEVPMLYNTRSATTARRRVVAVSVGLQAQF